MQTFNHVVVLLGGVAVIMLVIENPSLITRTLSLITNTTTGLFSVIGQKPSG